MASVQDVVLTQLVHNLLCKPCGLLVQVEVEIMLPENMSVKESHDIALMLQHKVCHALS